MDWQGQNLVEWLMQVMLMVSAVVAFVAGYSRSSFSDMVYIYGGGVGLTALVTVPDWPFFNRNPLQWLDRKETEFHGVRVNKPNSSSHSTTRKSS